MNAARQSAEPENYAAFGLRIRSAVALPELQRAPAGDAPDVEILLGPLDGPAGHGDFEIDPDLFRLRIDGIGRFEARGGTRLVIDPEAGARPAEVRAYLLGTMLGALLQQRGMLALHASAVTTKDGKAIAFVGESGAGKSTIAMALNARGHPLLCDDVCAVTTSGDGATAWPGVRRLKLWSQSIEAGGGSVEGLEPVLQREGKYELPAERIAEHGPHNLGAVILLGPKNGADAARIERLRGADALQVLVSHTFRGLMVAYMDASERHFRACLALLRHVPVYRLVRPAGLDRLGEACDAIEQQFRQENDRRPQEGGTG